MVRVENPGANKIPSLMAEPFLKTSTQERVTVVNV